MSPALMCSRQRSAHSRNVSRSTLSRTECGRGAAGTPRPGASALAACSARAPDVGERVSGWAGRVGEGRARCVVQADGARSHVVPDGVPEEGERDVGCRGRLGPLPQRVHVPGRLVGEGGEESEGVRGLRHVGLDRERPPHRFQYGPQGVVAGELHGGSGRAGQSRPGSGHGEARTSRLRLDRPHEPGRPFGLDAPGTTVATEDPDLRETAETDDGGTPALVGSLDVLEEKHPVGRKSPAQRRVEIERVVRCQFGARHRDRKRNNGGFTPALPSGRVRSADRPSGSGRAGRGPGPSGRGLRGDLLRGRRGRGAHHPADPAPDGRHPDPSLLASGGQDRTHGGPVRQAPVQRLRGAGRCQAPVLSGGRRERAGVLHRFPVTGRDPAEPYVRGVGGHPQSRPRAHRRWFHGPDRDPRVEPGVRHLVARGRTATRPVMWRRSWTS